MLPWLLILQATYDNSISITQVGPFRTEAACVAAGQKVKKRFAVTTDFVCVLTEPADPPSGR